jgi:large subunit ribosomal protein L25
MTTPTLNARLRTEHGSRACHKLRRSGEIPANLYKATKGETTQLENVNLAVLAYDMYQLISKQARILDVTFEGRTELVRVTEVQRDQFGDDVQHIDLCALDPSLEIVAETALEFTGRPQGIRDTSQTAIQVRRLNVRCKPREIPDSVTVNLGLLTVGDKLLAGAIELPAGVAAADAEQVVVEIMKSAAALATEAAALAAAEAAAAEE